MSSSQNVNKYLPLTEATYYIMLSLIEPLHGYGVNSMGCSQTWKRRN
jgi:hypothetical protein